MSFDVESIYFNEDDTLVSLGGVTSVLGVLMANVYTDNAGYDVLNVGQSYDTKVYVTHAILCKSNLSNYRTRFCVYTRRCSGSGTQ